MIGIFYFSSTGNSLYIAKQIKSELSGEMIYIPKYDGDGAEFGRLIVVSPVYSWGLPKHTYDLFPRLSKKVRLDLVLNYGGMLGGADRFAYEYAKACGLEIMSVQCIKMPENYTLSFTVPGFYLKSTLNKAPKRIAKVVEKLKISSVLPPKSKKMRSEKYEDNKSKWHLIASDFTITQSCVRCGKCVSICPSGNIRMEEGRIRFLDQCVACLGCYHRCPEKAIRYRNKTKSDRYFNPLVDESELG